MNRLEKKCFIASAAVHGLLCGIVLFGSAFFVRKEQVDRTFHQITVYDSSMVTDAMTQGSNPKALPAAANPAPQPPAPQPQPEPVVTPPQADPKPQVETP